VEFTGTDNALYERHLLFDNVVKLTAAGPRERFEAFTRSVRDVLSQRCLLTEDTYESGKFSSDRTIAEYAAGIGNPEPCPVS
jgi:hypothetical protein